METDFPSLFALVAWAIPLTLAYFGVAAPRRADLGNAVGFVLAICFALGASWIAEPSVLGVRFDVPTRVILVQVTLLGAVIARYSRNYLSGEPGREHYFRWLLLTLAAVTTIIVANSLLVIALAWTATSVALHQLLTFYSRRPAALVAAHKKFLVSRLADVALLGSLGLIYANVRSFDLDRIGDFVALRQSMTVSMEAAIGMLACAVVLRSAQLPFHGWITQVMEAPTPVSALLHAGVVNMGGFVLIRLAPWISLSVFAQLVLVSVGLATAIVAALVMTTRVSAKVSLAWSTCAQMGFMLVQCGLGLWSLALLHLVAHSLYKAYAFLSAGSVVEDWKVAALPPRRPFPSLRRLVGSTLVAGALAYLALARLWPYFGLSGLSTVSKGVLTLLFALSLVPLFSAPVIMTRRWLLKSTRRAGGVVLLYAGWHALAEQAFPHRFGIAVDAAWWLVGIAFAALFVVKSVLLLRPQGWLVAQLHPWLFAGFYIDEIFTRLTFALWPPQMDRSAEKDRGILSRPVSVAVEVQS
jgi:NAD(P)H-quinone oxidoreductase subunit 5